MIKIEIKKETREVFLDKNWLGNDNENLQETLEFSFKDEFVNGQARLELQFGDNGDKTFITLDKVDETYTIPVTNIMTVKGKLWLQLVITEGTNEEQIPIFKSNRFYVWVDESINAETGDREPYIEWIDRANIKLNQIDNLDIEAEKVNNTTTITITKKDGTQEETQVLDGVGLNYNWSGTSLGIKREDEQNYDYVNLKGDKGEAGAIKMTIVNELPQTGADDTIYLVPINDPETGNNYEEYVYVNNAWEKLGGIQVEVDLTDYVKFTDYATTGTGGVVKVKSTHGTAIGTGVNSGVLVCYDLTYSNYASLDRYGFISKGTLENVIVGKNLETSNNKVTSLSASSTDTEYPSAKCVYDIIGNINSAIDIINGEVI